MSERTLWATGLVAAALTAMAIIAGFTVVITDARQSDEAERSACVEAGGSYVGGEDSICILNGDDDG